jgi:hypothetical protein
MGGDVQMVGHRVPTLNCLNTPRIVLPGWSAPSHPQASGHGGIVDS